MTAIDICNMALGYIAKQRINSLEENREEARQCKLYYDHCRKMLLRDYNWGFAKKHAPLALLDAKVKGWSYVYKYPNNCLAIRFIYNDSGAAAKEYDRGKFDTFITADDTHAICTDIEQANIEFTTDTTDADMFSVDFSEALARLLASNIATMLTGNQGVANNQYQLFQMAMQRARTGNFYEQQKDVHFPQGYADARL